MIDFKVGSQYLDIADNTSVSYEVQSSLFSYDSIPGSRAYSFTLPYSRHNRLIFDFAEMPENFSEPQAVPNVEMYLGGQLYRIGTMTLREASPTEGFKVSFHTEAGAIRDQIKNLTLQDLPLHEYSLLQQPANSYADAIYPDTHCFPIVYNPDFYGKANEDFSGFLNYHTGQTYATNSIKNRYALTPMVFVRHVLDKIAQHLGYSLSGSWLFEPDTARLIVYSNTALDQKEGYYAGGRPLNRYAERYHLSSCLPRVGIGAFLIALKNLFGLALQIEPISRRLVLQPLSSIALDNAVVDWTKKASAAYQKSFETERGYTLSMSADNADALFENRQSDWLEYVIGSGEKKIEARVSPLLTEKVSDPLTLSRQLTVPTIRQKGYSEAFDLRPEQKSLRLLYYLGLQRDNTQSGRYPEASDQTPSNSLQWDGPTGRYARSWQPFLSMMLGSVAVETEVQLSINDLLTLDTSKKVTINGVRYLVSEVRLSLRKRDTQPPPARVRLMRIPY